MVCNASKPGRLSKGANSFVSHTTAESYVTLETQWRGSESKLLSAEAAIRKRCLKNFDVKLEPRRSNATSRYIHDSHPGRIRFGRHPHASRRPRSAWGLRRWRCPAHQDRSRGSRGHVRSGRCG